MSSSISYTSERASELHENISVVRDKLELATQTRDARYSSIPVTLVAVSKLKPASDILALYDTGHRDFGENYVQELVGKATELPKDIRWHFIGNLQSNKCNLLASIPCLTIQTIDSSKLASTLHKAIVKTSPAPDYRVDVFLQINTSGEDSKGGLSLPSTSSSEHDLLQLAKEVIGYPHLNLKGLMTIGDYGESVNQEGVENADFRKLRETSEWLQERLEVGELSLQLSMGMSSDFVEGVKSGSTVVRVGTSIFGSRPPRNTA